MIDNRESEVRTILESVLRMPLETWPAERPLEDAGYYDSLAHLEVISGLEKAFGLANGDIGVDDVDSIGLIIAKLTALEIEVTP